MLEEHQATDFGETLVDAAELLQSDLGAEGPRYTTLARVVLGHAQE
jgi:2'-5' RNA ligase